MDDWDARVIDGIAAKRHVVTFDNRGVGTSEGTTPHSVARMARDAVSLVQALELDQVDLVGFSLGDFIAQVIQQRDACHRSEQLPLAAGQPRVDVEHIVRGDVDQFPDLLAGPLRGENTGKLVLQIRT